MSDAWIRTLTNAAQLPQNSTVSETSEEVYRRWAYRLLLGRQPDGEAVEDADIVIERERLLQSIFDCEEFQKKYGRLVRNHQVHPYASWGRDAIAFIHLPKTGGTTLHALLRDYFPEQRICPERYHGLYTYTLSQLAEYDFFSGHFDYFSTGFIPRKHVLRICMFREPRQRLLSWYRFVRSHPLTETSADNVALKLANQLTTEEFFEDPRIGSLTLANNAYLFFLGSALGDPATLAALGWRPSGPSRESSASISTKVLLDDTPASEGVIAEVLARAVQRVIDLDAIGITERFEESVEFIFSLLGLPVPTSIIPAMVTDELPSSDGRFRPVPRVEMTQRLARALERLTRYDQIIYNVAKTEFDRRLETRRERERRFSRVIRAASLILCPALRNLARRGGAIKYEATQGQPHGGQPIFWGPYISLPSGKYNVTIVGEIFGVFDLRLTGNSGQIFIHQQRISTASDVITFSVDAPVRAFEVVVFETDQSERLHLDRILVNTA